jgi:hypothetical protein
MHFNDCSTTKSRERPPDEVLNIFEKQGTQNQPRVFINNLFFIVVDKEEKEKMFIKAREYLALNDLIGIDQEKGGIAELSKAQREKVDEKRKEAELFLKVAVIVAYRHLFVPAKQEIGNGEAGRRTMRHLVMRVTDADVARRLKSGAGQEEHLVQFLKENKVARDANDPALDPDYLLENLWPKKSEYVTTDEFRKLFFRNPAADLVLSEELIVKSLREGIKTERWYGYADKDFYDKSNHMFFGGGFSPETQLILVDSALGQEMHDKFYCPECKKLKKECQCNKTCSSCGKPVQECDCPELCPRCDHPLDQCKCPKPPEIIEVKDMSLGRAAPEIKAKFDDKGVEEVSSAEFVAFNRTALSRLASAGPQFVQAKLKFRIRALIDQRNEGKNLLRIEYEGDLAGFNASKPVLVNYEGRSDFSDCDIKLDVSFEPPITAAAFIELLAEKVGSFTQDSVFNIIVQPVRKEG